MAQCQAQYCIKTVNIASNRKKNLFYFGKVLSQAPGNIRGKLIIEGVCKILSYKL